MRSGLLTATTLSIVLLALARALAHPVPFSYLDLRVHRGGIDGALVVHILDVAHDLGIAPANRLLDPAFAVRSFDAIAALVGGRLNIDINARAAAIAWRRLEVVADRQSLRLLFTAPAPDVVATLGVNAAMFPYDGNHRTFVNVYEGDALTQAVLDRWRSTFEYFAGTRQGAVAVIRKFVPAGVHHILIGPDHLLFLVGLLLLGGTMLDKIKELSAKPVTLLINTHAHRDHVGANGEFPESVDVVAHANAKASMAKMPLFTDNANVAW